MVSKPRSGSTLVEILVAMSITGMLLLAARSSLLQVVDTARVSESRVVAADTRANRDRLLSQLFEGTRLTWDGSSAFVGSSDMMAFTSWCDNPRGWQEPCRVTVSVTAGSPQQVVVTMGNRSVVTHAELQGGHFEYLLDASRGGRWMRTWNSAVSAPLAIRMVLHGDTLFFRIGERG